MILKKKIPNDFYKLFRTKTGKHICSLSQPFTRKTMKYMLLSVLRRKSVRLLLRIQSRNQRSCGRKRDDMEEGETPDALFPSDSPSGMLNHLIRWGWLKSDFDEKLNTCVISFPEYSQLYVELFKSCRVMMTAGKERACFPFTVRCLPIILTMRKTMIF